MRLKIRSFRALLQDISPIPISCVLEIVILKLDALKDENKSTADFHRYPRIYFPYFVAWGVSVAMRWLMR
jgi:hypothetical protein